MDPIPKQDDNAPRRRPVFIDSCAVNKFALLNIDPTKDLTGSTFEIAYTPGLEAEYRRARAHRYVEPHIKLWVTKLLERGVLRCVETPADDADLHLVRLSKTEIVITMDRKPPWNRATGHAGLILWPDIESTLRDHQSLLPILEAHAALMGC